MENERSAIEEFLSDIGKTKENPFKSSDPFEKDLLADEVVEEEEKEEKPVPFHKDPKVQKYVEKEIARAIADFKPTTIIQQATKEEEFNLPSSFVKLVGNDTEEKKQVLKDLSSYFGGLKGEAKQEFLNELREREQQSIAEDNAALDELNTGFEEIEETYNVDLSSGSAAAQRNRAAFVDYLKKVSHKNEDGEVDQFADIPAAFEEFQSRQTKSPNRAKSLASRSIGSTQSVSDTPQGVDRSWKGVEKLFSQLSK